MKLKAQRVRTRRRFSNPIRYQRCTVSQVIHAGKPLNRIGPMAATALARPMVARLALSR